MYKFILPLLIVLIAVFICSGSVINAQTTQFTQPANIRVWFVKKDSVTGTPLWKDGVVGVFDPVVDGLPNPRPVPFEGDYLPNVVTKELDINEYSARSAQALAARTYALWFVNNRPSYCNDPDPSEICDVTDSTSHQDYRPNYADDLGTQVVVDSQGRYLVHPATSSTAPIFAEFSSDHSPNSVEYPAAPYYTNYGGNSYLKSIYDPITNGEESSSGHGHGLSQRGAVKWGRGSNTYGQRFPKWDYTQILAHYYTSAQMVNANGTPYWGFYRWNMLNYSPANAIYYVGESKDITMRIQNTGLNTWENGTRLVVNWRRTLLSTGDFIQYGPFISANVPARAPGEDVEISLNITPPADVLKNPNTGYAYQLIWDLQRPDQSFFASQGWIPQNWAIILNKRVAAPVAPAPSCPQNPCKQNSATGSVIWNAVDHPNPVTYQWRRAGSTTSLTGNTSTTTVQVPLEVGMNDVYVKTLDTTESSNVSAESLIFRALYDPFAPTLTVDPLEPWTNLPQLTLTWGAIDPQNGGVDGSQVKDYMVEQQLNGGTWTTLVASTQAIEYQVTSLTNNTTYTFRITARDWAGNQTQQTRTTTIDRDPPSSSLIAPTGAFSKTWTILRWTSSYDRAPIIRFAIDRRINTIWQPLYTTVGVGDSLVFEGAANTVYDLRIRAFDAAGNEQSGATNPQISFTTGNNPTGLAKQYFPIVLLNSPDSGSPSPTTAYPLPQP